MFSRLIFQYVSVGIGIPQIRCKSLNAHNLAEQNQQPVSHWGKTIWNSILPLKRPRG